MDGAWGGYIASCQLIAPIFATQSDLFDAETGERLKDANIGDITLDSEHNRINHNALRVAFISAISERHMGIAQEVFNVVWGPSYALAYDSATKHSPGNLRRGVLATMLKQEITKGKNWITEPALDMDLCIRDLQTLLTSAVMTRSRHVIPTLVENLMREKNDDSGRIPACTWGVWDVNDPRILNGLMMEHADAMQLALGVSIGNGHFPL
ncbi:uncharacterized protein BDV17DRAFT_289962 [Aspergillus undulatus]|uniref:uncharacterized protein n=1 Tax=Aspergillus undulatus TaxID=1810928 RepID=UPI003CCD5813